MEQREAPINALSQAAKLGTQLTGGLLSASSAGQQQAEERALQEQQLRLQEQAQEDQRERAMVEQLMREEEKAEKKGRLKRAEERAEELHKYRMTPKKSQAPKPLSARGLSAEERDVLKEVDEILMRIKR